MQGVIKNLNDKGFGFIQVEGQPKDLFFHAKDVVDADGKANPEARLFNNLRRGDKVEFEIQESDRGPKAGKVMKLAAEEMAA